MDHNDLFGSALSSIVSSPISSNTHEGDDMTIRELIGKLGSVCDSGGGISPGSYNNSTPNTSCYNTPLNSPPKLSLSIMDRQLQGSFPIPANNFPFNFSSMPFIADPGFTERAARFSCFGVGDIDIADLNGHLDLSAPDFQAQPVNEVELGRFSMASSSQSPKGNARSPISAQETGQRGISTSNLGNGQTADSREGSSISEHITCAEIGMTGQSGTNSRKRKSIPKVKAKESSSPASSSAKDSEVATESEEPDAKKTRPGETNGSEKDGTNANQKQGKDSSKPPEPPKDYIHVRARRGQATDSHSLAERVRREKISQRMKFLQDLVPGCNKVTGKAVMLDEIINYVQSLQRQVEFLSMKLATLNPRTDPNMEAFLTKDIFNSRGSLPISLYPVDASGLPFYGYQPQQGLSLHSVISSNSKTQSSVSLLNPGTHKYTGLNSPAVDGYDEAPARVWEDDLQSVVQMVIGQNQPQILEQGSSLASGQMKIEL